MKVITIAAILVLSCQTAYADWLLKFKDRTASVWPSYTETKTQYCTLKAFGEYCVLKADVAFIKEVPAGTEASEYSVSSLGGKDADRRKKDASEIRERTLSTLEEQERQERYQKQRKQYKHQDYDE